MLKNFVKRSKASSGRGTTCKSCANTYYREKQYHLKYKGKKYGGSKSKHAWYRLPSVRYSTAKAKAKRRGLGWSLPKRTYFELLLQVCHYCNGPLPETSVGLDRVRNSIGYRLDNVVPCCTKCNVIKGEHLTYEQMLEIKRYLIKWQKTT